MLSVGACAPQTPKDTPFGVFMRDPMRTGFDSIGDDGDGGGGCRNTPAALLLDGRN
jgi:hypothetical protein